MKETKMLDYPHALLAVRHLGRFHAYSFAIRDKKPEEFEILREIKEPFFPESGYYKNQLDALMDVAIEVKIMFDLIYSYSLNLNNSAR